MLSILNIRHKGLNINVLVVIILTVRTQRRLNVHTTSSQRYGRRIDVETTLCAYIISQG